MTDANKRKLTPVQEKFILHWGEMGARWGIIRTVAQIHALLFLSEEIRTNVRRGADAAEQLARVVEEITGEALEVRRQLERSRTEGSGSSGRSAPRTRARRISSMIWT